MKHILLLTVLFFAAQSDAATLEKGAKFPAYTVKDAFGTTNTLSPATRFVIIASEKSVSGAINDWLAKKPADFLSSHKAEYVSDITPMPAIITTLFALPKMKKYPFRILLADDPAFAATYPSQPGKIALFTLDPQGAIQDILFATSVAEVEKALLSVTP